MLYRSTRNSGLKATFAEAVLKGIPDDGGLFVPEYFPEVDIKMIYGENNCYADLCARILGGYLSQIGSVRLEGLFRKAYFSKFDSEKIAEIVRIGPVTFLELFHGPTMAFKDMALSVLPHFMLEAGRIEKSETETVILVATSGDTGKAALEAFRDIAGIKVIVVFPEYGVSRIQKAQMKTQEGRNLHVIGIDGNFDDAQTAVKRMFEDKDLNQFLERNNMKFTSANSINIGRLLPQIVYYFHAYFGMVENGDVKLGEKVNFCVPTGNFGDILAGYYAGRMGLPVNRLICASNRNRVLTDFFRTGRYDIRRDFFRTSSPSMDILISSNLERMLFHALKDVKAVTGLMNSLRTDGFFETDLGNLDGMKLFYADYCDETETSNGIRMVYDEYGYVMDTHTSVAYGVYEKYRKSTGDGHKTVVLSTASPFKFSDSICDCLGIDYDTGDMFSSVVNLGKTTGMEIPEPLIKMMNLPVLHDFKCRTGELSRAVMEILGGSE